MIELTICIHHSVTYFRCISSEPFLGLCSCQCRQGFTGPDCSIIVDRCASSPCLNNGRCIPTSQAYVCQCDYPFSGVYIFIVTFLMDNNHQNKVIAAGNELTIDFISAKVICQIELLIFCGGFRYSLRNRYRSMHSQSLYPLW